MLEWLEALFGVVILSLLALAAALALQAALQGVSAAAWGLGRGVREVGAGLMAILTGLARLLAGAGEGVGGLLAGLRASPSRFHDDGDDFVVYEPPSYVVPRAPARRSERIAGLATTVLGLGAVAAVGAARLGRTIGRKAGRATARAGRGMVRVARRAGHRARSFARDVWADVRYDPASFVDMPAWAWAVEEMDAVPEVTSALAASGVRWRWVQGEDGRWRLVVPTEDVPLARAVLAELGWDLPPAQAEPVAFWDDVPWGPYEGEVVEEEAPAGEGGTRTRRPPDPAAGGRAVYERYGREYMRMLGRLGAQARWERERR